MADSMKHLKNAVLFLAMSISFLCVGCGKDNLTQVTVEKFSDYPETVIGQEKTDDEITVTLNHIAFERKHVIVDYTVEAPNAKKDYKDGAVQVIFPDGEESDAGGGVGCFYQVGKNSFSLWSVLNLEEIELSEENVGQMVEVRFYSLTGGGKWGIDRTISFDVEISKLFDTEYVELNQPLGDEQNAMEVKGLECSTFYTRLVGNFGDGTYWYQLASEDNRTLYSFGGHKEEKKDAEFFYEAFPQACESGKVWLAKNGNPKVKSEAVEFALPQR